MSKLTQGWWHTAAIPDTQEAKIGKTMAQSQPEQKVYYTPCQPVKAGCEDTCLSLQLYAKYK
jgi:hypothetical protein